MEIAITIFFGTLMVLTVIYVIFTFFALSEKEDDKNFWLIMSNCIGFLVIILLVFGVLFDLLNS